jgi:hypothetical protein
MGHLPSARLPPLAWGLCYRFLPHHRFPGGERVRVQTGLPGDLSHSLAPYFVIQLVINFLRAAVVTLLIGYVALVGTLVYHSCKAVRLRWCQRPGRPTTNIRLQVPCRPSTATSNDRGHLAPPPYTVHFMSQPSALLHSFNEEAQKPPTVHAPSPTHPHIDARPSRDRLNLTIRTDGDTQRAGDLILGPIGVGPSGIRSLERGGDTEMNSLGGSIKGEADRRFAVESSPKKHVRIGRGRDLA